MYYLGVDGGGTKTRYILIDEKFKKLVDVERGTIHIHQVGIDTLRDELTNTIESICIEAKIRKNDIDYIFLAIPGYGESIEDRLIIDSTISKILEGIPYSIDNDCVAGWAAGTGCSEGINIVVGTGSIAFGKNKYGETSRSGGWGPVIGDDGSAHWIGLKVINEYTKQKDGRKSETQLLEILEREMEIKHYYGIVDLVFNKYKLSRTEIASFSKIAALAAEAGCPVCKGIFEKAAEELFLHIISLSKELNFDDEFIVSYTGGVFKAGELILKPMAEMIEKEKLKCKLTEPKLEPWNGAALMAYSLSGRDIPENYTFK
ncbi:ATPase [Clostridium gasigenes]|uniref:N-acetylglucosamine kinase n=1 Tax=Clostridium gasigenes TaxID=94869 RepID=UPI00143826DC|nr:BadF/BadG/BcrA/BcrD ATPase family protein [Clostridium gasigenes]NKF06504.1 ATPase [Clostridium gasigenes]QSW21136.1 ATPase [Clostridium gasigenes]